MSTPPNLLASYRTYSYHHVLVVCDSTQTAEFLAGITDIEAYHHPEAGRYQPRPVIAYKNPTQPGTVNATQSTYSGETGNYIVLINGLTDSTLFIDHAKWETIITPQVSTADGVSQAAVIQTEGELTIIEPMGMNFLNLLSYVSSTLNSDPMGLVFLLKTFFVGVRSEVDASTGRMQDVQETITNVRPFMFIPVDITSVFGAEGGSYSLQICGVSNGVGHLAPVQNIASDVNLQIKKGQTLKSVMADFATQLNHSYEAFVQDIQKKFTDANVYFPLSEHFRFVYYKIEVDPGFENLLAGTNEFEHISDKVGNPIIPFKSGMGIIEAIDKIMMSCGDLVSNKDNVAYKITSRIETTKNTYWVIYTVERYVYKTISVEQMLGTTKPDPGQTIEFDYIFTGKNVDVLDFDLRMDLGLSFWQMLATSQTIPAQSETLTGKKQTMGRGTGGLYKISPKNDAKVKTPLFFGAANAETIINNYKKPTDTIEFRAMMNRQAAIENVQCRMKILGNPQLLDEMLVINHKYAEQAKIDQTVNPNWNKMPTLVKVNIRTPVDMNDLYKGYETFWYTDYYQLFSITNEFSGDGSFTQELDMFAIPLTDSSMKFTDEQTTHDPKTLEKIRNQTSSVLGTYRQNLAQSSATVVQTTTSSTATEKTAAELRNHRNTHRDNIISVALGNSSYNYDILSTTADSRQNEEKYLPFIKATEINHGIPRGILHRLLWVESHYQTNIITGATVSSAGALGIAQFMPATAQEMGFDPLNPYLAIDGAGRYLHKLYGQFHDWALAIAAYNAGPAAVQKYGDVPPFYETQKYVETILYGPTKLLYA